MTSEQRELRQERIAIMSADGEGPDEIEAVLAAYPELYGEE
jgi:hypothetical protein